MIRRSLKDYDVNALRFAGVTDKRSFEKRTGGDLAGKAYYLEDDTDWKLVKDVGETWCLIPLKKQGRR